MTLNSADSAGNILGNTKPKCSKKASEVKRYCFTLNNYTDEDINGIIKSADSASILYIFGKEVGVEQTPHLQGYINMPVKNPCLLSLNYLITGVFISKVVKVVKNKT